MPPQISVVVCTHNPRPTYFVRVIQALHCQTIPMDGWEFVVIDNASAEPITDHWSFAWHPHAKIIREEQLGIIHARQRGIRESVCGIVVFVDDDNVLERSYLERVLATFSEHHYLGVIGGGRLDPEYEIMPTPELAPYLSMLAIRSVPEARWSNNIQDVGCIPWGAGLSVRRHIAEAFADFVDRMQFPDLIGRNGKRLFCGEDDLFSHLAVDYGSGFGIFPELQLTHLISASRLTCSYFLRLLEGHGFSHEILSHILKKKAPQYNASLIRDFLHSLRCGWFEFRCRRARFIGARQAHRLIHYR